MMHLVLATDPSMRAGVLCSGELQVEAEWPTERKCVLGVAGEVDMQTAPALARSLASRSLDHADSVVVDLARCTFLDAAGLTALIDAHQRLQDAGIRLVLVSCESCVLRAFEATGLDDLFTIHASVSAALAPPTESWVDEARRRISIRCANERLEQSCVGLGCTDHERFHFICECGDRGCVQLLHLSVAEYESVREHAARFAIWPNHENPEVERVVRQNGRFAVVETVTGLLSKSARETNPRWQRGEPW